MLIKITPKNQTKINIVKKRFWEKETQQKQSLFSRKKLKWKGMFKPENKKREIMICLQNSKIVEKREQESLTKIGFIQERISIVARR